MYGFKFANKNVQLKEGRDLITFLWQMSSSCVQKVKAKTHH